MIFKQSLINFQLKFINPKNNQISITFVSVSQFLKTLILSLLIYTLQVSTIQPKKLTLVLQNLYFYSLSLRLYLSRAFSTLRIYLVYYFLFLEQTSISSKYIITNISKQGLSTLLISSQNIASALVSLNSITIYSKCLYRVLNAIFYSSPSIILIRWYLSYRSNTIKIFA